MFELTVLLAASGCVIIMFLLNQLPWLYHPCFKNERFRRATDDRFFIVIEARDPKFYRSKTEALLESLGASAVDALRSASPFPPMPDDVRCMAGLPIVGTFRNPLAGASSGAN